MAEPVPQGGSYGGGYYVEPPEVLARNIFVGVRLAAGALVTFYGAFLFAYVYLRERDTHAVWRPHGVKVPLGTGIAVLACVLASAAVGALALGALRRSGEPAWRPAAALSQLLLLGALGVQCYQWAKLGFGPGSGPYASVFIAWTGFFAGVGLLSALYWGQTELAASIRHRHREPGPVVAVAERPGGEGAAKARIGDAVGALVFYLVFLAAVQVVTFVPLYIVA